MGSYVDAAAAVGRAGGVGRRPPGWPAAGILGFTLTGLPQIVVVDKPVYRLDNLTQAQRV